MTKAPLLIVSAESQLLGSQRLSGLPFGHYRSPRLALQEKRLQAHLFDGYHDIFDPRRILISPISHRYKTSAIGMGISLLIFTAA